MKKLLILFLLISFSGYTQTYQLEKGIVMGMPTTFVDGSYIKIYDSVLELNIATFKESKVGTYKIIQDETQTFPDRTIRDMRLESDKEPNLRIHGMVVSGPEIQTKISVNVYDMDTEILLPYVIYIKE